MLMPNKFTSHYRIVSCPKHCNLSSYWSKTLSQTSQSAVRDGFGEDVRQRLNAAGIPVTWVRRTKHRKYIADFYVEGMQAGVRPAEQWARYIRQRFSGVTIEKAGDQTADWRPGQPVIWASVVFSGDINIKAGSFEAVSITPDDDVCRALAIRPCMAITLYK